jgi:cytochrome P450
MEAWLVTSYAACKEVMRQDKILFRHPFAEEAEHDEVLLEVEGRRSRNLLHGEEHARHHRWYIHRFSPTVIDRWRPTLIRPVIDSIIDRFAADGKVELAEDFSERFSIRVIAAMMHLPWQDDDWIAHCKGLLDAKLQYLDTHRNNPDEATRQRAMATSLEMNELLRPYIEEAREREPDDDDILALLWRDGPSIMPEWSIVDMVTWATGTFFAGTDTTTHAIENGFYLMMTVPGLQDSLRDGGPKAVSAFAEEVLRLYGAVQFRFRKANEDTELAGVRIKKDDLLLPLHASANRDAGKYAAADEVDLRRRAPRDHLAFSFGPRTCAGQALARAEIEETMAMTLERLPDLRLDPDAEPPRLRGFLLRSYRPLHALFTPSA